ncbi:SDR family NAD(P)-dependent oxidoreductase [Nocardia arthritidis]|uniref:SDR family NAD(P)-dependent oxidoreductase n=1 Tax=Nocardia arthritidis TaxID=228602 RepID=A0A6G9YTJ1_9NOCA|nr:SDR family oxidoreductase [Nocardia arthritidis]QIS16326.1 SDR family NAD(P)-dependent oxidoreductase [Nocardia arthritidis]
MTQSTKTALVTGASSGIGAEFAAALVARGDAVILVARSADRLEAVAAQLRSRYHGEVHVIAQDLTEPDAAERIANELAARSISIDILVNSAGFGSAGRFEELSADGEQAQLMVNVVALAALTRRLVPGMLTRGAGEIINVASTAAFQPAPYFATYAAGKAFVLNFSLALWSEYRGRGIKVLAVCPGPTETAFFDVVGTRDAAIGGRIGTAAQVVSASLRALERDRGYVVPGFQNFASAHLMPRRPRAMVARIAKQITRGVADAATRAA